MINALQSENLISAFGVRERLVSMAVLCWRHWQRLRMGRWRNEEPLSEIHL